MESIDISFEYDTENEKMYNVVVLATQRLIAS